ncbi:MAG: ROK family protein [Eubacteriales bacterium]|nr:ROK family protein [Eubacteriales bacterium]
MPKADLINNTYRVKLTNKTLIKNALKSMGTATRTEVSQKTGLSIATCRNILNELVRDGEVLEDALEATNTVGRPARRYSFNKDFSYVAGINMNIDGEERTLQYVVANLDGEIIADEHEQRETVTSDDLVHLTDTLMEKWPSITALALGIPGTFSKDGEIFACDFTDLNGTNIKEAILASHSIDITMASIPDLVTYGYYSMHPNRRGSTVAGLIAPIGQRLGAGIVIDGSIYKGSNNLAGEVSYMYFGEDTADETNEHLYTAVSAIITLLGPDELILYGRRFSDEVFEETCAKSRDLLQEDFLPRFVHIGDCYDEMLRGIVQLALSAGNQAVRVVTNS